MTETEDVFSELREVSFLEMLPVVFSLRFGVLGIIRNLY